MSVGSLRDALSRLLATQTHSFARYLTFAAPFLSDRDQPITMALQLIVQDQQHLAERIADYAIDRVGRIEGGAFPMEYTSTHDLALDYLLKLLLQSQQREVAAIQECNEALKTDPKGWALAQEALGAAKGHLQTLHDLLAAAPAVTAHVAS